MCTTSFYAIRRCPKEKERAKEKEAAKEKPMIDEVESRLRTAINLQAFGSLRTPSKAYYQPIIKAFKAIQSPLSTYKSS